jgi:hypothetical protein
MTPHHHDPLATTLAKLPGDSLDPRAAAAVLRRARGVLVDEGRPAAKLQRFWSGVLLPAVLLACAAIYSVGAFQTIERIYVAAR